MAKEIPPVVTADYSLLRKASNPIQFEQLGKLPLTPTIPVTSDEDLIKAMEALGNVPVSPTIPVREQTTSSEKEQGLARLFNLLFVR